MTNINIQITEINGLVYLAIKKEGNSTLQTVVDNKEDLIAMIAGELIKLNNNYKERIK